MGDWLESTAQEHWTISPCSYRKWRTWKDIRKADYKHEGPKTNTHEAGIHEQTQAAMSQGEQTHLPPTDISNTETRCHIVDSDVATKWQTMTEICHSSSLLILKQHGKHPLPTFFPADHADRTRTPDDDMMMPWHNTWPHGRMTWPGHATTCNAKVGQQQTTIACPSPFPSTSSLHPLPFAPS